PGTGGSQVGVVLGCEVDEGIELLAAEFTIPLLPRPFSAALAGVFERRRKLLPRRRGRLHCTGLQARESKHQDEDAQYGHPPQYGLLRLRSNLERPRRCRRKGRGRHSAPTSAVQG